MYILRYPFLSQIIPILLVLFSFTPGILNPALPKYLFVYVSLTMYVACIEVYSVPNPS